MEVLSHILYELASKMSLSNQYRYQGDTLQSENNEEENPTSSEAMDSGLVDLRRPCIACNLEKERSDFSKTQWRKASRARCKACTKNQLSTNIADSRGDSSKGSSKRGEGCDSSSSPTPLTLETRPLRDVPGFEGNLTVCRDWPQTKNGKPPSAQSLIFNPLIACVIGPIEGHSTKEQIEHAIQWWSLALPAWPCWIQELKGAGVPSLRSHLLSNAKGKPNALIPKTKGRGTVPHFPGKMQEQALEMAPTVAIEVDACIACLYAAAVLDESDK